MKRDVKKTKMSLGRKETSLRDTLQIYMLDQSRCKRNKNTVNTEPAAVLKRQIFFICFIESMWDADLNIEK